MSGVKETKFLVQHELSECKYGLIQSLCSSKQKLIMMNVAVSVKNR